MKDIQEMEQLFKHYMGVLSKDLQHKFDLVIEGQHMMRREIRDVGRLSDQNHDHNTFFLKNLIEKVDAIAANLTAHRNETEAHGTMWQDRENVE
jgi:hypothetical protein